MSARALIFSPSCPRRDYSTAFTPLRVDLTVGLLSVAERPAVSYRHSLERGSTSGIGFAPGNLSSPGTGPWALVAVGIAESVRIELSTIPVRIVGLVPLVELSEDHAQARMACRPSSNPPQAIPQSYAFLSGPRGPLRRAGYPRTWLRSARPRTRGRSTSLDGEVQKACRGLVIESGPSVAVERISRPPGDTSHVAIALLRDATGSSRAGRLLAAPFAARRGSRRKNDGHRTRRQRHPSQSQLRPRSVPRSRRNATLATISSISFREYRIRFTTAVATQPACSSPETA